MEVLESVSGVGGYAWLPSSPIIRHRQYKSMLGISRGSPDLVPEEYRKAILLEKFNKRWHDFKELIVQAEEAVQAPKARLEASETAREADRKAADARLEAERKHFEEITKDLQEGRGTSKNVSISHGYSSNSTWILLGFQRTLEETATLLDGEDNVAKIEEIGFEQVDKPVYDDKDADIVEVEHSST